MLHWLRKTKMRFIALLRRDDAERDLEREIAHHIALQIEKNLAAGMSEDEARREAHIAFGSIALTREDHRQAIGLRWLEDGLADAHYALRSLRHSPGFAAAAVFTLAIGIAANSAIFSAVDSVLLRGLPFPRADRLVMLWESNPKFGWHQQDTAVANVLDWRDQVRAFTDVAFWGDGGSSVTLTGSGPPALLHAAGVSGNFFSVLGVNAERGRVLRDKETWKSGEAVVVISHRLWRTRFGSDPKLVNRTIDLNGRPARVVGVMPANFAFPDGETDAWIPLQYDPAFRSQAWFRRAHWARAVARLAPGVSLEAADAQLQTVVKRLQKEYPDLNNQMGAGMTPLHSFLVREARTPLLILWAAAGLILLIACANIGNLLLAQAIGREREAALRLALGAGRGRLVRQALAETSVLSVLGGSLGIVGGLWGIRVVSALQPAGLLSQSSVALDWRVLGFILAIMAVSGALFGSAPVLWRVRRNPAGALREGGRGSRTRVPLQRWARVLVVLEVALALLLTLGAGLLVRSYEALLDVDPGFDPVNVLAMQLDLGGPRYDTDAKALAFYDELIQRAGALPGVTEAAATSGVPLTDWGWTSQLTIEGRPPEQFVAEVAHREVAPGYFRTMRIPLLRGRDFTKKDDRDAARVVLINQALARQQFPHSDPIGQRVAFDKMPNASSTWRTIVGVVGDVHQTTLAADTKIQVFTPLAQAPQSTMIVVIRSKIDAARLEPQLRKLVSEMDSNLPIAGMRTMEDVRATSLRDRRFLMSMLLAFAATGLLLAVVGVYGVMARFARGRVREMGIRIALGAGIGQVRWLVLGQGLRLVGLGLTIGLVTALASTRTLRSLLFEVTPVDATTFVVVSLLLLVTSTLAIWLPAAGASRANPAAVLRDE